MLGYMIQELWIALRGLMKVPVFSAAVILLIAFGIGLNMTVASIADGFVHRPMPGVPKDNRLVMITLLTAGEGEDPENSYPNFVDYAAQSTTVRGLFGFTVEQMSAEFSYGAGVHQISGAAVTPAYFDIPGLHLALGRTFLSEENRSSSSGLAAIISYRLWNEQFGGAPDVLGKTITVNNVPATIVGVAPPLFRGLNLAEHEDVWVPLLSYSRLTGAEKPLTVRKPELTRDPLLIYGNLAPGASIQQAQAEFATISKRLESSYPADDKNKIALVQPYAAGGGHNRKQQMIIFGLLKALVVIVLLIVSANIANMMILRANFRLHDFKLRQALGASRSRIFLTLLAEGVLLSGAGFVVGCFFSIWASRAALSLIPTPAGEPLAIDFRPDWGTMAYGFILALASTLLFCLPPLFRLGEADLNKVIRTSSANAARGRSRLAVVMTASQIAFTFALLTDLWLVYGSMSSVNAFNSRNGFDKVVLVLLNTEKSAHSIDQNAALIDRLYRRLIAIPGVDAASYSEGPAVFSFPLPPLRAANSQQQFRMEGNRVGPGYFHILAIQGMIGRDITSEDATGSVRTVVVNQHLAHVLSPSGSALGQIVRLGSKPAQVVGIVPDGILPGFSYRGEQPFAFVPEVQDPVVPGNAAFYIRYRGALSSMFRSVTAAIQSTDNHLTIRNMQTMVQTIDNIAGPLRMLVGLLAAFAIGALLVTLIGLYVVVAAALTARTREIGVRIACGATPSGIMNQELRSSTVFTAISCLLGLALGAASAALLRNVTFGVTGADVRFACIGTFVVLAGTTVLVHFVAAFRASHIEPSRALREE